jgi:hypothetical protein
MTNEHISFKHLLLKLEREPEKGSKRIHQPTVIYGPYLIPLKHVFGGKGEIKSTLKEQKNAF